MFLLVALGFVFMLPTGTEPAPRATDDVDWPLDLGRQGVTPSPMGALPGGTGARRLRPCPSPPLRSASVYTGCPAIDSTRWSAGLPRTTTCAGPLRRAGSRNWTSSSSSAQPPWGRSPRLGAWTRPGTPSSSSPATTRSYCDASHGGFVHHDPMREAGCRGLRARVSVGRGALRRALERRIWPRPAVPLGSGVRRLSHWRRIVGGGWRAAEGAADAGLASQAGPPGHRGSSRTRAWPRLIATAVCTPGSGEPDMRPAAR